MRCRFCGNELYEVFASLGSSPLSNSYLTEDQLKKMEPCYPLEVYVCHKCLLVQLDEYESPKNIFNDYAYFSSYSDSWLNHCKEYAENIAEKIRLNSQSQVVEIASNDGYLLQFFKKMAIPVLGIEPAINVANVALEKGIPTKIAFFGEEMALSLVREGITADLLLGNNVLAHVPDINDFVRGLKIALKPTGIITMEFPHLMRLVEECQFDTIYHEHFSYLSFLFVENLFAANQLTIVDVEELPTHGGSLRIYVKHTDINNKVSNRVNLLRQREIASGMTDISYYRNFNDNIKIIKRDILTFLIQAKSEGKTVIGYGAAAKGNTFLNYCGIRTDFIDYVVDRSPHKQGRYLPGSRIPIKSTSEIEKTKPDYVLILPWNIKHEIMEQMECIRTWGGEFVTAIPRLKVM
ncbi:MAG: class I SAM-dependent methyltransferase [Negativicutes bacterium]|nr:class I SAM-dependent methyltransferase [Negativicutes bacterium]